MTPAAPPPARFGLTAHLISQLAFGLLAMTISIPSMQDWPAQLGASQASVQLTFSGFVADHVVMPGPEGESGRGLAFLDALASRWGVIRNGESCVWFELDL